MIIRYSIKEKAANIPVFSDHDIQLFIDSWDIHDPSIEFRSTLIEGVMTSNFTEDKVPAGRAFVRTPSEMRSDSRRYYYLVTIQFSDPPDRIDTDPFIINCPLISSCHASPSTRSVSNPLDIGRRQYRVAPGILSVWQYCQRKNMEHSSVFGALIGQDIEPVQIVTNRKVDRAIKFQVGRIHWLLYDPTKGWGRGQYFDWHIDSDPHNDMPELFGSHTPN